MFNFLKSIPYNPVLESGDSFPYFGTYEGQRFGQYDTDCCWDFSACELTETRMEMLWKLNLLSQENKDWLTKNGYIDSQGDFYFSRRWVAILSGVRDAGNVISNFWSLAGTAGLIPNYMLPYDAKEANKWITKNDFNNYYFNEQVITKEMELLGQEFARRFNIRSESFSGGYLDKISVTLQTYLKEGSVQISIPVPQDNSWNRTNVEYPKGRFVPDHAVELYKFAQEEKYPFFIYDSYEPHLKQLSNNYYISSITRVSITEVKPIVVKDSLFTMFWKNVYAWINKNVLPYPNVPIGKII